MRLVAATGLGMIGGTAASAAISKGSSKPDAEESLDWAKVRAQFDLAPGSVHQADIALGMGPSSCSPRNPRGICPGRN
jgi:hypothetical protein